ncbi:hypothetical protein SAMN04487947_1188 [Halogeometricum rufum]|uniref:Uncharacterized protein n=2 Tax=Halogeometricum rufum TaxID=553469 RepID=A0A1I6GI55_9EURY|nr:hypothetical protein SAMN04487947_1188 [Halogeometricum rufum]
MPKRRITASCTNCDREFDDRDELEAHDCRETVYVDVRTGRKHRNPDCGHAGTVVPRHESVDGPECGNCEYWQLPALEDHDDQAFLRQQGLDGSVGDGQATLDGGIRPPRDRGQLLIQRPLLCLVAMILLALGAAYALAMFSGGIV